MSAIFEKNLDLVRSNPALLSSLAQLQRGIEKECLRTKPDGTMAQTPHPKSLGSALCHPKITTDYSESLLEFITPVHRSLTGCLSTLEDIHHFTYHKLAKQNELLWSHSMPCQLGNESDIPVAQYGSSNVAKMKTVYRLGLGHRYGRIMQTISGIHYNFSLSDTFWINYQRLQANTDKASQFKTDQYFALIRNFRRFTPLFVYLFGASPALCRSFVKNQTHDLKKFDDHTWHEEHATSLRMGDLGYQSSAQNALSICYNSLPSYIESLRKAITQPLPAYEAIGLKDERGEYKQLNTALLQIENEFYSSIRPKRVASSGEAPINALLRGGVEYVEVRSIDVDPFSKCGIDAVTIRFLDLLLLYCLLQDSPKLNSIECPQTTFNLQQTVKNGRAPDATIEWQGKTVKLKEWGLNILENLQPLANMLDSLHATDAYQACLDLQRAKLKDSSLTPSAQILKTMSESNITFAEFARRQSAHWQDYFLQKELSKNKLARFEELAADSLAQQQTIEEADTLNFEQYLDDFYQQYYS